MKQLVRILIYDERGVEIEDWETGPLKVPFTIYLREAGESQHYDELEINEEDFGE